MLCLFKQHLISNEKSPNTISSYLSSVKAFIGWFQDRFQKVPKQLFVENVADYKVFLQQRGVAPSTFNSHMAGLRSWNEYLIQTGKQDRFVIQKEDWKKVQHGYASPAVHSEADVQRFIQTVLESKNKRDYALVNLLAYTGLQISEALSLVIQDLYLESQELLVRDGKGNKSRTVFLSDKVVRLLRDYLKQERSKYRLAEVSPYVFLSNRSQQLSRITVFKSFSKYSKLADMELTISPHDLRHFFCSNALEKGLNVHEVASIAGHSNIHTTLLYTNPSRKAMLAKLNLL
ncbi:tyrosine-type recombinase/integrase [Shimazuella sp. KC615]|uniref:Tyrosine-type recombinase/integrase n=1 Tax=Shimazuella alba TaxID=2690964 RepID=A0A6I4VMZ1_9BACL|nr:tyrosine-type recombinase/integrase [Shimazuella alba]